MGTHGRGGLSKLLMGSVAGEVVEKANVPVTLVK
jgi:nucleotide-binding universal stress UspA family protein